MTAARVARSGLLFITVASLAAALPARAETGHKSRRSVPAKASRAAPDVTATITRPLPPPAVPAPSTEDTVIPPPFTLPPAPRATVRACGETWRDMKLAGTTGDDDWREFAQACFTGKALPAH